MRQRILLSLLFVALAAPLLALTIPPGQDIVGAASGRSVDLNSNPAALRDSDGVARFLWDESGITLPDASDILGTANQVQVTGGAGRVIGGNVTLGLPQSIDISAAVRFGQLGLGGAPGNSTLYVRRSAGNPIAYFRSDGSGGGADLNIQGSSTGAVLHLHTNPATDLSLSADGMHNPDIHIIGHPVNRGYVGFGKTNPAEKVDVAGKVKATAFIGAWEGDTVTNTDFTGHPASGITAGSISNWNTAHGWGNHATQGYLTGFTETDPQFAASPASGITGTNINNWNTAHGWGNHATQGYLKSLPQALGTTASPTFGGLTINGTATAATVAATQDLRLPVATFSNPAVPITGTAGVKIVSSQCGDVFTIADGIDGRKITIVAVNESVIFYTGAKLRLGASSRVLTQNDTLTLVWAGGRWVEVSFSVNQ